MMKKRICAMFAVVALCFSLAGCNGGNQAQPEGGENSVMTEQPADPLASVKEGIVGTWVVEKHEIYDGPMKDYAERATNMAFPIGSEHIFTADGGFENTAMHMTIGYEIINDHQIRCIPQDGAAAEDVYDYELNGDELILYGNYTGDFAPYGHCNAMYFTRK